MNVQAPCYNSTNSYHDDHSSSQHHQVLGSSYQDVLSLIAEAKSVSDSIDKYAHDMKAHFEFQEVVKQTLKKTVRFALDDEIEYVPLPSAKACQRLYYSDQEQHEMVCQLHADVHTLMEQDDQDWEESDDFTARGLEKRTPEGIEERTEWRVSCRDAVLDEQDRQWNVLALDESCDEDLIAEVSLFASQEARRQAREVALEDERQVYGTHTRSWVPTTADMDNSNGSCGKDDGTVATSTSESSWKSARRTSSASSRLSNSLSSFVEEPALNSRGVGVHWPDFEFELSEVISYQDGASVEDVWEPYYSLEDIKVALADQISNQERGLERLTPAYEERYQKMRLEMFLQVYSPSLKNDDVLLAKQCKQVSAPSRRQARQQGLQDEQEAWEEVNTAVNHNRGIRDSILCKANANARLVTSCTQAEF